MFFKKHLSARKFNERFRALQYVHGRSMQEERKATADYDAVVRVAEKCRDGYLVGYAETSSGNDVPIRVSRDSFSHLLVQGTPGGGKSKALCHDYRQHVEHGRGGTFEDCKADTFEDNLNWTCAYGETLSDVERERLFRDTIPFNAFSTKALVPLNVCCPLEGVPPETQAFEITGALTRLFPSDVSFQMENLATRVVSVLIENRKPQLSLVEASMIIRDETLRLMLAHESTNEQTRRFLFQGISDFQENTKQAVATKFDWFPMIKPFRAMFGANECLDFRKVIQQNQRVLLFLGKHVSAPHELVLTFGNLAFQLVLQAGYSLGSRSGYHHRVQIDEFPHLVNAPGMMSRLATALSTTRSFGLEFVLANHDFSQIPSSVREALLTNVDRFCLFRSAGDNADWFGDFLEVNPNDLTDLSGHSMSRSDRRAYQRQVLQSLPNRHFIWYDRLQQYGALRLRAPNVPDAQEVFGLTDAELDRIRVERGWDIGSHAVPIETLEAQIAERHKQLAQLLRPPIHVTDTSPDETTSTKKRRPRLG